MVPAFRHSGGVVMDEMDRMDLVAWEREDRWRALVALVLILGLAIAGLVGLLAVVEVGLEALV